MIVWRFINNEITRIEGDLEQHRSELTRLQGLQEKLPKEKE